MRLTFVRACLALTLCLGSAAAFAEQAITGFTLENGMKVVVIEDHRVPVVNHMVWYRIGSADDPRGGSGIAHFFEHLMFKGTDTIPEGAFSTTVAENGGQDNAFTSYDYTGYFQRIAVDRLGLVMGMEADRMRHLILTEEVVATERAVILEERSQRVDNSPQALFGEQMDAVLYLNHPYRIPVIGWRHEIEQLGLEDARSFYRRYYAPDNAILVVAGDVIPEQVLALAEQHYGPIAPSGQPPEARPQEPPHLMARRVTMRDARVRQPYMVRDYLAVPYGPDTARESAALSVLSSILGDGVTSRLSRALELEQKVAIGSGSYYTRNRRDVAEFSLHAVPAPGHDLAEVEAAIDAVLAEMIASGPTEEELARIKRLTRAGWIYGQDNVFGAARAYGAGVAIGLEIEDIRAWPEHVEAVTAEDVRAVAEKYLVPERSVTGYLLGTGEGG
ncbi:MAG TPA: pitrilysin family protein [Thermohalobaculum sp.]|nr:pitrilysin family protein [Thermohalobaculum sp.]